VKAVWEYIRALLILNISLVVLWKIERFVFRILYPDNYINMVSWFYLLLIANVCITFVLYRNWLSKYGWLRRSVQLSQRTTFTLLAVAAFLLAFVTIDLGMG
jgi:hypothetical protein